MGPYGEGLGHGQAEFTGACSDGSSDAFVVRGPFVCVGIWFGGGVLSGDLHAGDELEDVFKCEGELGACTGGIGDDLVAAGCAEHGSVGAGPGVAMHKASARGGVTVVVVLSNLASSG